MSPGVTDEAGSTARALITSLATTPMILALVVFNLFYIATTTYFQIQQGKRFTENQTTWEHLLEKTIDRCQPPGAK